MSDASALPRWIVPPRSGRPYLGAESPAVMDGERGIALDADRRHLVSWRGAGEAVSRVALPAGLEGVRGVVLGDDRVAVLSEGGVHVHADGVWGAFACDRPRYGAFGADGGLYVIAGAELLCIEASGALRFRQPCDFEQPLVAVGAEVRLVDWGVTLIIDAAGEVREVDNGADAPVAGAVRVGDAVVALTYESSDGVRKLLVLREGEDEEQVELPEGWEARPFAAAGGAGVLVGTEFFPLDGGASVDHRAATVSAYGIDAVGSDGAYVWALRGGAVSTWRLGEPEELGPTGLSHLIAWDAASDGRLALVVPGELVLVAPDGAITARVAVPKASQVRFFAGESRVAVTNLEGAPGVRAFDAYTGALVAEVPVPIAKPQRLVALPDGSLVVSEGFTLHLLGPDLAPQGACRARPNAYASAMDQLAAAGPWLVGLDTQRTLHVFTVPEDASARGSLSPAHTISRNIFSGSSIALVGDELVACGDGEVARWSLVTGKKVKGSAGAELAGRGGPVVWGGGAVERLDGGAPVPCAVRPSAVVAAGARLFVEVHEGVMRLA